MDLLCMEKPDADGQYLQVMDRLSFKDPAIFQSNESKVLDRLLELEQHQRRGAVDPGLFGKVQHEIQPNMRRIVSNWMLEVRRES